LIQSIRQTQRNQAYLKLKTSVETLGEIFVVDPVTTGLNHFITITKLNQSLHDFCTSQLNDLQG